MNDPIEDILAPAVIERAMTVFESFRIRDRSCRLARLTPHIFGLIVLDKPTNSICWSPR
jgi:hypothetical protein